MTSTLTTATHAPPARPLPRLRRAAPLVRALHHLAQDLASRTDVWAARVRFAHETRWSVRVAATPDYEAWLLTWLPGQSTGLHDHGGSAGAFVVVEGELEEATLAPLRRHQPAVLVHRTLVIGRHRSFGPHHVHEVRCAGKVPAVSLHVYAPALASMRRFVLDDDGRAVIVARERAGVDW